MSEMNKITAHHIQRDAFVFVHRYMVWIAQTLSSPSVEQRSLAQIRRPCCGGYTRTLQPGSRFQRA